MGKNQMSGKYRKVLLSEKERIEHERRSILGQHSEMAEEIADNHPGDAGSETFERTKELAIDAHMREVLDHIDEALRKIDEGTFGKCESCGEQISSYRLKEIPYASLCIECQERIDGS